MKNLMKLKVFIFALIGIMSAIQNVQSVINCTKGEQVGEVKCRGNKECLQAIRTTFNACIDLKKGQDICSYLTPICKSYAGNSKIARAACEEFSSSCEKQM